MSFGTPEAGFFGGDNVSEFCAMCCVLYLSDGNPGGNRSLEVVVLFPEGIAVLLEGHLVSAQLVTILASALRLSLRE